MSGEKKMAHCTLCHADFVPTLSGDGGHACPLAPSSFDDARATAVASTGLGCVKCSEARAPAPGDAFGRLVITDIRAKERA